MTLTNRKSTAEDWVDCFPLSEGSCSDSGDGDDDDEDDEDEDEDEDDDDDEDEDEDDEDDEDNDEEEPEYESYGDCIQASCEDYVGSPGLSAGP